MARSLIPLPTQRVPIFACPDVSVFISAAAGPEGELNISAFFTGFGITVVFVCHSLVVCILCI